MQVPPAANPNVQDNTNVIVPPYVYRALDHSISQIRLLRISPFVSAAIVYNDRYGVKMGPIKCNVETFDLDSAPPYLALSYAWGKTNGVRHSIQLNGGSFEVTRTLYDFLCCFRPESRNRNGETYLWIVSTLPSLWHGWDLTGPGSNLY
jgi:hypothetical protein